MGRKREQAPDLLKYAWWLKARAGTDGLLGFLIPSAAMVPVGWAFGFSPFYNLTKGRDYYTFLLYCAVVGGAFGLLLFFTFSTTLTRKLRQHCRVLIHRHGIIERVAARDAFTHMPSLKRARERINPATGEPYRNYESVRVRLEWFRRNYAACISELGLRPWPPHAASIALAAVVICGTWLLAAAMAASEASGIVGLKFLGARPLALPMLIACGSTGLVLCVRYARAVAVSLALEEAIMLLGRRGIELGLEE